MNRESELTVSLNKKNLDWLNEKYKVLSPAERIAEIYQDFDNILFTSSFGTTAVYLIHLMKSQGIQQPVHFIDTSFHFDETILYKNKLKGQFDLDVIDVAPEAKENEFSKMAELFRYDPDRCCLINKVNPLNSIKGNFEIWISGLMGWQNQFRRHLNIFEEKDGIIKFYPIIDVQEEEALAYIRNHNLPEHPLKPLGYESVGCKHCTIKGEKRNGRWAQQVKTECGLHQ